MKKEWKLWKQFIKEHQKSIFALFLVSFFTFGFKLFHYSISIDTETILTIPTRLFKSWIGIGRPVLVFLKYVFPFRPFNPFLAILVTYILFTIFTIFLYYLFYRKKREKSSFRLFLFGSILLTSAIYIEQLGFLLQSAEISIIFLIFCFSVLLFLIGQEEKKKWYYFFSFLCLTFCFGAYQSFVPLFITVIALLTFMEIKEGRGFQSSCVFVLPAIFICLFSGIGYIIGCKICNLLVHSNESVYLSNQIVWFKQPIVLTIKNIFTLIFEGYFGVFFEKGLFYGFVNLLAFLFLMMYLVSVFKRREKNKFLKCIIVVLLLFVPFSLTIFLGAKEVYRAQLALPVLVAFTVSFLSVSFKNSILSVLVVLAISNQFILTHQVLVSDYFRYLEDVSYANLLYSELKNYNILEKRVVMLGGFSSTSPLIIRQGETLGHSFFHWDLYFETGVGERASRFMQTLGYPILTNTKEDFQYAKNFEEMLEVFPNKNSILETEELVIVRLS